MNYDDIARAPRTMHPAGYVYVRLLGEKYRREHIVIAETALGRRLPAAAMVHHVNENKSDNRRSNLVICQDERYHKAIHKRMRVRRAGGNPWCDWICSTCQCVKPIAEFHKRNGEPTRECKPCACARVRAYSAANRATVNARQQARRIAKRG